MILKKLSKIVTDVYKIIGKNHVPVSIRTLFVYDYLKIQAMNFLHGRITDFTYVHFLGFKIEVVSFSEFSMLVSEVFIDEPYRFVAKNTTPHIVDCGGNIGMSVLYFKWIYPKSSIIVFEPSPVVSVVLHKNIINNKLENVEMIDKALSNEGGVITFYLREGMTLAGTTESREAHNSTSCEVESVLLSEYILKHVDFLKVDVQFSEQKIFSDLLKHDAFKYIDSIIMEFHHAYGYTSNSFADTLKYLEKANLHYYIKLNNKKSDVFASYIVTVNRIIKKT